jgi:transposase-like protein
MDTHPKTLLEAVRYFTDLEVAHDFFVRLRWPNGVACPRDCGSLNVFYMPKRHKWQCRDCKRQFTAKVGTVFEDSPIGFDKWMPCVWLIANAKNGISSHEIGRALGVTQKTAWFMLHRVRLAMGEDHTEPLRGEVEADETYIGGKRWRGPNIRGSQPPPKNLGPKSSKAIVMGIMQRGGAMRAFVIPNDRAETLIPKVEANVLPGSRMYTDAHKGYYELPWLYRHEFVNHVERYVEGHVHTNHVENFWNLLKRMLLGGHPKCTTRGQFENVPGPGGHLKVYHRA